MILLDYREYLRQRIIRDRPQTVAKSAKLFLIV